MPLPSTTPVICGPTAGGKSDLAVALALALRERDGIPAEILSADAFQIYRGMDIGTAKPTPDERRGVPHHLIDLRDPRAGRPGTPFEHDRFTVDDWLGLAHAAIADCRARAVLPIVVGGTHLYIKALLDGLFEGPDPDPALREQLAAMDPAARRAELERVDPPAAARIHPNDARRTIRALEVHRLTGRPISDHQTQWDRPAPDADPFLLIVLDWETDALNRRINARVKAMMDAPGGGLLAETRSLVERDLLGPQAAEALGYKQLLPVIAGRTPVAEAAEQIKIETRRFAKNQRTWLRRLRSRPGALPLPMPATAQDEAVARIRAKLLPKSSGG